MFEVVLVSITTGRECHWLPRRLLDVLHSIGHLPMMKNDLVFCPHTPELPASSSGLWTWMDTGTNYARGFPGSPACRWETWDVPASVIT